MDIAIALALVAVLLVLGALLAHRVYDAWRHPEPLPLFSALARFGLSARHIRQAVGPEAYAAAVRRCELCKDQKYCARALAADRFGHGPIACPSAELFEQAKRAPGS